MSTSDQQGHGPLTRKQLREIRLTGSTPVITPEEAAAAAAAAPQAPPVETPAAPEPAAQDAPAAETAPVAEGDAPSGLTRRQVRERARATGETEAVREPADAASASTADLDDDDTDDEIVIEPVSAAASVDSVGAIPLDASSADVPDTAETAIVAPSADAPADGDASTDDDPAVAVASLGIEVQEPADEDTAAADDVLADVDRSDDDDLDEGERPTVNSAFGQGVLADGAETPKPFSPSFDELLTVGDSTGSQHLAPNTLIFNPSPGDGSLSGPVASTGEILVTGSYELPKGLGSQGHAHGTTDGKDVDAVLIDGELAPASSPTPIAASAAVSTIKPAGEIIRPPAPEKGNKLMLILAIVAGGLALALGVALIVAFTTNVF